MFERDLSRFYLMMVLDGIVMTFEVILKSFMVFQSYWNVFRENFTTHP